MKKLLALIMVLGMASVASADIVLSPVFEAALNGRTGLTDTDADRLQVGDEVTFMIALMDNDFYGPGHAYAAYDGFFLGGMNINLTASASGTLAPLGDTKLTKVKFDPFVQVGPGQIPDPLIQGNGISQILGLGLGDGIQSGPTGDKGNGPFPIVWNLKLTAQGTGNIVINLASNADGAKYSHIAVSDGGTWLPLTSANMGSLTLYCVPEPMTIALLGLGSMGLAFRRRRRA